VDCVCISVICNCNSVDDIIFVQVLVLTLMHVPLYSPLHGLPNGHCALSPLGFVLAAGSALRPFSVSYLVPSAVNYLPYLYVCSCGINIICRYLLGLLAEGLSPTSSKDGVHLDRQVSQLYLVGGPSAQRFIADSVQA